MSDSTDQLFLELACKTPLSSSRSNSRMVDMAFTAKPYTRAQAKFEQQTGRLPYPRLEVSTSNKKRVRKSEFEILTDTNDPNIAPAPTSKKSKPNGRIPLAVRGVSASTTPAPVPRRPGEPFSFSSSDPLWEDVENYDARVCHLTPPSTPGRQFPMPDQPHQTLRGFWFTPPPSPCPSLPPSTPPSTNTAQPRRAHVAGSLPQPVDMVLYDFFELIDWKTSEDNIRAAYKKIAKGNHPDKVTAEKRENATQFMQTLNAAKEVLLDSRRRRTYHKTGKLPWTT